MDCKSYFLSSMSTIWCYKLNDGVDEDFDLLSLAEGVHYLSVTLTTEWHTEKQEAKGIIKFLKPIDYIDCFLLFNDMPVLWGPGEPEPWTKPMNGLKAYKSYGEWLSPGDLLTLTLAKMNHR